MTLTFTRTRGLALYQDRGRPGYASAGVSPAGAANQQALIAVNLALGNEPGACVIELIGECALAPERSGLIALAGAPARVRGARPWDSQYPGCHVWAYEAGQEFSITSLGLRTYIGFRGGLDVAQTLGSASTDTLSGLGPAPIEAGARVKVGTAVGDLRTIDPQHPPLPAPGSPGPLLVASVYPGPRQDWVVDLDPLFTQEYRVSEQSDRVGIRLDGPPLARRHDRELPSEGVVRGAIQIPPSGEPVIFGPDHPTTGGYPVVGVIAATAADALAHAAPGQIIRFRRASLNSR